MTAPDPTDRDTAIARIKAALKARSRLPWSVTGGRGTAWGWICISAPPARCRYGFTDAEPGSMMGSADRAALGELLGLDGPAHPQGVSIAASSDYRREYVDRAEGRAPTVIAQPYWD